MDKLMLCDKFTVSRALHHFDHIIKVLEDFYNIRPFAQQSSQSLAELYLLAKGFKPGTIIEIGCGTRSSTIALSLAVRELGNCEFFGVDISPINFPSIMAKVLPDVPFVNPIDIIQDASKFMLDPSWPRPLFLFYDAHDQDIPGVVISDHAIKEWFPLMEGGLIAFHDFSVSDYSGVDKDHKEAQHFSGLYLKGFDEVIPLTDWMNDKRIPFYRPGDELLEMGFDGSKSSLIYVRL